MTKARFVHTNLVAADWRALEIVTLATADGRKVTWCYVTDPEGNIRDHRPVPAIAFHGTADPLVTYAGGRTPVGPDVFPGVPAFPAEWARRNGCGPEPVESAAAPDVTRLEYTGCAEDAGVVLFTVDGGGHQWPGGRPLPEFLVGSYTRSIDATRQMWAFFREPSTAVTTEARVVTSGPDLEEARALFRKYAAWVAAG